MVQGGLVQQVGGLKMKMRVWLKKLNQLKISLLTSFLLIVMIMPIVTRAQEEQSTTFIVSYFDIQGANPLSDSSSRQILKPYLNRAIGLAALHEAASALQKEMARKGFNFHRAVVPAQILDSGQVTLEIKSVDIGSVNVFGNQHFSNDNIKRSLPVLASGGSPNTQRIASALLLAEDNPAKDVRVIFVKGDKPNTVNANIGVTDKNPNELSVWSNNAGSQNTSRARLGVQYHNRNVLGRDHQASLSFTTSPENPSELSQYGLVYKVPFYGVSGVGNFFYSRSDADTGRIADAFDVSGAGESVGFGYTQLLKKIGAYQHRVSVKLSDKLFDSDILFNAQNIGTDVRSRPLSIDYTARYQRSKWVLNSVISASSNISGGSFNNDFSYNQSRLGADADWNKVNLSLRYDYRWNREWSGSISSLGQYTSDSLISGEKFGLGGGFGNVGPRGFNEREVSSDKGYKVSLEAVRSFNNGVYRLGAFVDYADGRQNSVQIGENVDETLASVGLSFDWRLREDLNLAADYGYILDGVEPIGGVESSGSQDGDGRLHLSIRYFPKWPFESAIGGLK